MRFEWALMAVCMSVVQSQPMAEYFVIPQDNVLRQACPQSIANIEKWNALKRDTEAAATRSGANPADRAAQCAAHRKLREATAIVRQDLEWCDLNTYPEIKGYIEDLDALTDKAETQTRDVRRLLGCQD